MKKAEFIHGGIIANPSFGPRSVIFFLVLAGLGFTIYREPLSLLITSVLHRHGSSHGLFVPIISAYLIWLKYDQLIENVPHPTVLPGSLMVAAGLLIWLFSDDLGIFLPVFSFILIAAGLILCLWGRKVFRIVAFPLFFLMTMVPLPAGLHTGLAEGMRQMTTGGSLFLLKFFSIPFYRDGFYVHLPNINLFVDFDCSGIRYLLSYFFFSCAYAFRFKQTTRARLLIVAASLPISVIGGVIRLLLIFLTAYTIGPFMTERLPHVLLSWSVFTLVLFVAVGFDQCLSKYLRQKNKSKIAKERYDGKRNPAF